MPIVCDPPAPVLRRLPTSATAAHTAAGVMACLAGPIGFLAIPAHARAQSAPAAAASAPLACPAAPDAATAADEDRGPVVVSLAAPDGTPTAVPFRAWDVDLRLEAAPRAERRGVAERGSELRAGEVRASEVRLTRVAGVEGEAAPRLAAGAPRVPVVVMAYGDSAGGVRVRLTNVTVAAQRLAFPAAPDALEEQATALAADVCQLAADRADAARRLAELEALDRRKLAAAFELARLGDQVRVLDARLAAGRRRLALLRARLGRAGRATEELTLRAERAEVLGGGR